MFTYKFVSLPERDNILRLRLTSNRRKTEISLGLKLSPEDLENALSKKPLPQNVKYRKMLQFYTEKLEEIRCSILESGTRNIELDALKPMVMKTLFMDKSSWELNKAQNQMGAFLTHFLAFIDKKQTPGTKGVYQHTISRMRAFDADVDSKDFADIDYKWLCNFEAFLAQTACKNSRNIHLRNIRAVFNDAIDDEITTLYPFRRFKIKPEPTRKRALTLEQLRKLFNYPVEPYQELYRDMFKLIFLLIGINPSDLHKLTAITADNRVEYKRAKTHKLYSIKVEPEAMELINKYKGVSGLLSIHDRWSKSRNFIHQTNIALQRIGKVKRVGRGGRKVIEPEFPDLTSYWARHTWATIAASLDIPKDTIAHALGHGSNTVTDIYIDFDMKKVDKANRAVIDWVLYGSVLR